MKRFTNILYSPSNRSDDPATLARVVDLANRNSADLTILGVVKAPTPLQRLFDPGHRNEHAALEVKQRVLDKLLASTAHTPGNRIDVDVEVGRPAVTVIERVLAKGHDLVIVNDTVPSQTPAIKQLLRKCPCPVWVIKPARNAVQRVLAAVNPHPDEADLNRLILELASSMVDEFGGELHVAHAWEVYGDAPDGTPFDFSEAVGFEQLRASARAAHAEAMHDLLADGPFADAPWRLHLERGPADDVIPQIVRDDDIDLLVMGTIARTGLDGIFVGNTAERILDEVSCSILAVKPPGFVSPIRLRSE